MFVRRQVKGTAVHFWAWGAEQPRLKCHAPEKLGPLAVSGERRNPLPCLPVVVVVVVVVVEVGVDVEGIVVVVLSLVLFSGACWDGDGGICAGVGGIRFTVPWWYQKYTSL